MIKLIVNVKEDAASVDNWIELDVGDSTIALTIQANDIAELKNREANRTNTIKLPKTHHNLNTFKLANYPNSKTNIPYQYFDCRGYDNGVEIFGLGSKLELIRISKSIEVCIYASLFDLFSTLKDKSIQELNLGILNGWTNVTVAEWLKSRDPIIFPLVDWASEDKPSAFSEYNDTYMTYLDIKANYILPAYKFHNLLTDICTSEGYTLSLPTSVTSSKEFNNIYIPFSNIVPTKESSDWIIGGTAYQHQTQSIGTASGPGQFQPRYIPIPNVTKNFTASGVGNISPIYTAKAKGKYHFKIRVNCTLKDSMNMSCSVSNYSGGIRGVTYGYHIDKESSGVFEETFVMDMEKDDYCMFIIACKNLSTTTLSYVYSVDLECVKADLGSGFFPADLIIALCLPDVKQLDILLLFAQLFCLIVRIDEENKIVIFNSFDDVINNIKNNTIYDNSIKNWSDKIDSSDDQVEFQINSYAQENIIAYEKSTKEVLEETIDIESKASIFVNDETLEKTKNLFTIAPKALEDIVVFSQVMAKIRVMERGTLSSISQVDLHLLHCEIEDGFFRFYDANFEPPYYVHNRKAVVGRFEPVSMENMIKYYLTLQNCILKNTRVLKQPLRLTPIDISRFNHTVPVYIQKYNCMFYVNKIENYIKGKATKVELYTIRMPE